MSEVVPRRSFGVALIQRGIHVVVACGLLCCGARDSLSDSPLLGLSGAADATGTGLVQETVWETEQFSLTCIVEYGSSNHCTRHEDCCNHFCLPNGACRACRPPNAPCKTDDDCCGACLRDCQLRDPDCWGLCGLSSVGFACRYDDECWNGACVWTPGAGDFLCWDCDTDADCEDGERCLSEICTAN